MGDSIKHEFSLEPVDTGRRQQDISAPQVPGQITPPGQPGAPVTRPSFLTAFLANLGPAMAGGLANNGDPRFPFGTGLPGALQGIQQQNQRNREFGLQQQEQQRLSQQAGSTQALQAAQLSRLQQETPLDLQEKQLNIDVLRGQLGFYANPENLNSAVNDATQTLGKLEPSEQAQLNAAKQDAKLKRSFDPISNAVKTIAQDRFQISKADETSGYKDYLSDTTLDKGIKNKNRATFLAWKAKQSPAAMTLLNMLPQGAPLDQAAERYSQTGELPPGFARSPETTAAIIKRAAALHPEQNISANKAEFKANQASLKGLQETFDQVTAFENTAGKNLDLFLKTTKGMVDSGSPLLNIPLRAISQKGLGGAQLSAVNAARTTALTEIAKVLNSSKASGVLSDSARGEVEGLIGKNATIGQIFAAANILKQDMANRHQSYQMQIDDIKKRISGGNSGSDNNAPMKITLPSGKEITIK